MSGYSGNWFGASPSYVGSWFGALASGSVFPSQFQGFRVFHNSQVIELCLVAENDAPLGMGGVLLLEKNGTNYAVYLVETTDPYASPLRIQTTTGIKAVRLKT